MATDEAPAPCWLGFGGGVEALPGLAAVRAHGRGRTLLLCWPSFADAADKDWDADCVAAYAAAAGGGAIVALCGELAEHCALVEGSRPLWGRNVSQRLQRLLRDPGGGWDRLGEPLPLPSWLPGGSRDTLTVYRCKQRAPAAPSEGVQGGAAAAAATRGGTKPLRRGFFN